MKGQTRRIFKSVALEQEAVSISGLPADVLTVLRLSRQEAKRNAADIIRQANEQAQRLRKEAEASAEAIVAEAEHGKTSVLEDARQQGYDEGYETGRRQAYEEIRGRCEKALGILDRMIDAAEQEIDVAVQQEESEMVRLCTAVAGKVVDREVQTDPETVTRLVRRAVELARERRNLTVRIHPDDREILERHGTDLAAMFDDHEGMRLCSDRRVMRGSCLVEAEWGTIDARFNRQLDEIARELLRALPSARTEQAEDTSPTSVQPEAEGVVA